MLVRPVGDTLTMQQLYYAADVRSTEEIEIAKPEVKPAELKLARQLIDQQTSKTFDPAAYTDELRARLQTAIDKKVEGQEISVSEAAPAERWQSHRSHGSAARQPVEERIREERPQPISVRARRRSVSSSKHPLRRRKRPRGSNAPPELRCRHTACRT